MSDRESEFKTLTDVGNIGRGKSKHRPRNDPDLYGGNYPFVQTGDVKHAPFYLTEYTQTYNERGLAQSKLWPPGTLCITIAANIADTAILKLPACFPDSILGFAPKRGLSDVRYVKYCLDGFRAHMELISRGTTQDNLSLDKLLKLRFWFPHIEVQRKIAAILSAYDDLIANNQRRIALLEGTAEEIYREWFVRMRFPGWRQATFRQGIPANWATEPIEALFKTVSGGTPSRTNGENFGGEIHWVKTGELKSMFVQSTDETLSAKGLESSAAKVLPKHTVVMAMYCAMPDVAILGVDAATNQACCALLPKRAEIRHEWAYFFAVSALQQMVNFAHGAAQQNLSQEIIRRFRVLYPGDELVAKYADNAKPLFEQIALLSKSTKTIAEVRDALLPRLISGKLKVDHLDIRLPPSMRAEVEAAEATA